VRLRGELSLPSNSRNKLTLLLLAILMLGLIIQYLYGFHAFDNFYSLVFVATILVSAPTLYLILFKPEKSKLQLVFVLACATFFEGTYFLYAKDFSYVPQHDPLGHWQITKMIMDTGHIPFGNGVYMWSDAFAYSFYPAMHVEIATLSSVTGLPLEGMVKLFPFVFILMTLFMYLFCQSLFGSKQLAAIASFVFAFSLSNYPETSYRFFAMIFLIAFLFAFVSFLKKKRAKFLVVALLFLFALSVTHHLTLYITLAALVFLYFFDRIPLPFLKYEKANLRLSVIGLFVTIGILWPIFFAGIITAQHFQVLAQIFSFVGKPYAIYSGRGYTGFEVYFDIITIFLVIMLGFLGFLEYRKTTTSKFFMGIFIYFSLLFSVFYIISSANPSFANLASRSWSFLLIGISPLVGYFLSKQRVSKSQKKAIAVVGFFILLGFSLASMDTLKNYFDHRFEEDAGYAIDLRGYGERVYASVQWYSISGNTSQLLVGDRYVVTYGRSLSLNMEDKTDLLVNTSALNGNLSELKIEGVRYIFEDGLMSVQPEFFGLTSNETGQTVITFQTVPASETWNTVYENGLVDILEVPPPAPSH